MGAFPSHDAPELLYTTMVTRPTTEIRVEVCLVPLLPRFFNDGHKKLKKKLSDLLVRKLPQISSTPAGVRGTNNNSTTTATTASGGSGSGNTSANSAKRQDQTGGTALVDYIMSCTESFFFVNTKVAVGKRDEAHEEQQKHPGKEKLGQTGSKSTPGAASSTGVEPAASQQQPQPHSGSHHTGSHHSIPSLMRPVPFAVCILESENSSTDSNSSASNQQHASNKHHHQAQNNNTVLIKGRRLQLVGFVSCCMDRQITQLNTSNSPKLHALNGVSSNSCSASAASGTTGAGSSGDCKQQTYPVVLDVIFDDVEAHDYLTESVVLLASFAFRKQFVDSCALCFPAGDNDVEVAFDRQMERLQLRIVLRHDFYRGIRMFYSHYTLLDMIKGLEMHNIPPAHFSLYENNFGEYGMEVTFSNMFLARWMRFVEKKMTVDSVNGYYVRCVTSNLQQERFRLMQERQDSGAFLEEEEDDERLFGGALLSVALKQWLMAGSQSLLHQQMQHHGGGGGLPALFPGGPAAAGGIPAGVGVGVGPAVPGGVALGGYWPQMPMVMGAPPSWPAGVVPFAPAAPPMASVMGQTPSFVIPGGRPQIIYAAPQGGSPFVAQGGMHIVPSPAGPYGVMAPAQQQQQQQIVYVLPSGQMAQAAAAPAQPQAATATAVPTATTTATAAAAAAGGGAPPAAYPTAAMPQVYYTAPATYAVSYQPYMYQQISLPPPPPPPPQKQQQQQQPQQAQQHAQPQQQ
ncbi:hypothetical protein LSM04_003249 [Trypanosoma melophagium]|uniref:uncharacterized protein n=1 Tax=Trypanosoma melophagium TaxID=715481 RepID=UPI00351A194C|nr:hypothetical protein LSM04_003249 [Trypanosoma melophagium]